MALHLQLPLDELPLEEPSPPRLTPSDPDCEALPPEDPDETPVPERLGEMSRPDWVNTRVPPLGTTVVPPETRWPTVPLPP